MKEGGDFVGLEVKKIVQGSSLIFTLKGILDISTTNLISSQLEKIENIEVLVFDFSKLEFIDSTGIGSILEAIHLSQEKSFSIRLQGVDELTDHVFETVGLNHILRAVQEEEA